MSRLRKIKVALPLLALGLVAPLASASPFWASAAFSQTAAPQAAAPQMATQGSFTTADLEKMVAELSLYIPQHPDLQYPIVCAVETSDNLNAYASTGDPTVAGGKRIPKMTVLTGLMTQLTKACTDRLVVGLNPNNPAEKITLKPGDEKRLLRAVVAHEMAHLSKGHVLFPGYKPGDLDLIFTREIEYEADAVGASALQRGGFSKQDCQDMLMFLDANAKGWPAADRLLGDHADCKRRAVAIATDPRVLRSLIEFDLGMAFAENRNYLQAMTAFGRAGEKEPKIKEAFINGAQAAAMNYYFSLDGTVRGAWYRPDFGPLLGDPLLAGKGGKITPADERNYALAEKAAALAQQKAPSDLKTLEVVGLVQVLDPKGDPTKLTAGIGNLKKAMAQSTDPREKLRIANNLAIGYQRTGDVAKGIDAMLSAQRTTDAYNPAIAQNLGLQPFPGTAKADAPLAAAVLLTFLNNTPKAGAGYGSVQTRYAEICKTYGFKPQEIKSTPIYLLQVLSLTDGNDEIALFSGLSAVEAKLGRGEVTMGFLPSGTERVKPGQAVGVFESRYRGGNVLILAQKRGTEGEPEVLRVTSYSPGATLALRPKDETVASYRISVGMTKAEIDAFLNTDKAPTRQFIRVGKLEDWKYFPNQKFGVCFTDGKVSGITVTPANR